MVSIVPLRTRSASHPPWEPRPFCARAFARAFATVAIIGGCLASIAVSPAAFQSGRVETPTARQSVRAPRIVVVKSTGLLHLYDRGRLVRTYPVTIGPEKPGRPGTREVRATPQGDFYVCTKNGQSPHHRFLGLSYPDRAATEWGWRRGWITAGEAGAIVAALNRRECPPWNTALGGGIGLHGAGDGRSATAGCVALRDADVEELFDVLRIGDEVQILP